MQCGLGAPDDALSGRTNEEARVAKLIQAKVLQMEAYLGALAEPDWKEGE